MNRAILAFLFFICIAISGFSQPNKLEIEGRVMNENGTVKNALVKVFIEDSLIYSSRTKSDGFFAFDLPLDEHYFIVIQKLQHYDKWISLEAKGVKQIDLSPAFRFGMWEVEMIGENDKLVSVDSIHAGRVYYNRYKRNFDWERYEQNIPEKTLEAAREKPTGTSTQEKLVQEESLQKRTLYQTTSSEKPLELEGVSEVEHDQFALTEYLVKEGTEIVTLKKIHYHWGGTFYFKDEISIREGDFKALLKRMPKEELATFSH